MTICKTWFKPFHVLNKNRTANMTSVDCATQLVDEWQVKRRKKSDPQLTEEPSTEEKVSAQKTVR